MPDKPRTTGMIEDKVREEFKKWVASCPRCIGTCDGDLVGEEHDDDCPAKNGGSLLEMDYFDIWNAGRQAAWDSALEAAAKVIINLSPSTWARGTQVGAAEIRALKGKEV